MRRPSVLFINRVYPPSRGATGRILSDMAQAMAREGWDVTVLSTGPKSVDTREGGVRVVRIKGPAKPGGILGYMRVWWRLLRAAKSLPEMHLVVSMTDPPLLAVAGQKIAKAKKARHIHWCQDLYPDLLPVLGVRVPGFAIRFFEKRALRAMQACDKVIVIGRCMAKVLTDKGIAPANITVIPNWPDAELMAAAEMMYPQEFHGHPETAYRPHENQLKDGPKFRILYAGNLGRAHPVKIILEAASILRDQHPEIEFVFVGDGPVFDAVAAQREKQHLTNIRLLPYQPLNRLRTTMESGDVHLVSMKKAAMGMLVPSKIYSAFAVGRPCIFIGPEESEAAKVIYDFNAGSVVTQGDVRGLVDTILHYRMDGQAWFDAHEAALEAGRVFVPQESMKAWIERAWSVIEPEMRGQFTGKAEAA